MEGLIHHVGEKEKTVVVRSGFFGSQLAEFEFGAHISQGSFSYTFECWSGDDATVMIAFWLVSGDQKHEFRVVGRSESNERGEKFRF